MYMKKFIVKSIQEGWEKIYSELGENAIIIETKEKDGKLQIIAALPEKKPTYQQKFDNPRITDDVFKRRYIPIIGGIATGKTTTIAKVASILKFSLNRNIAIASFDYYKIGGFDNLKKFAEIMQIPFYPIKNEKDIIAYRESFENYEHIIFDSPGNLPKLPETEKLLKFITKAENTETILILSLDKKESIIKRELSYFSKFNISHVILTKLDELEDKSQAMSIFNMLDIPVSYVCNGLDVPGDILKADEVFNAFEVKAL